MRLTRADGERRAAQYDAEKAGQVSLTRKQQRIREFERENERLRECCHLTKEHRFSPPAN